jgi:hypothetical protein
MKRLILLLGCLSCLASPLALAEVSDEEIRALREQIRVLSERLDQLEEAAQTEGAASKPTATATTGTAPPIELDPRIDRALDAKLEERMAAVAWAERIGWSGDFRYRFENTQIEAQDDRNRSRVRARTSLQARASNTVRIGFGLASGSADPVSSNQTLGAGGSSKQVNLDLAYFEWSGLAADTTVIGGKYKNPLQSPGGSELIWDGDWRPEGLSFRFDSGAYFARGLATWLESDSKTLQQEFSYGLQGGIRLPLGDRVEWLAGVGYYEIDTAGKGPFFGDGDFFGNSFDPVSGTYLFDYRLVEGLTEVSFELLGKPAMLFGHYVQNLDPDEDDTGYQLGFQFGAVKSRGQWKFGYSYRKVEADAVLGLLTNSDFGGGGTDAKGSILQGAYAFHDNWSFSLTYLINETGLRLADPQDFDLLQLDLNFKYR